MKENDVKRIAIEEAFVTAEIAARMEEGAGAARRRAGLRQDGRKHPRRDAGQRAAAFAPDRHRPGANRSYGRGRHRHAGAVAHLTGRTGVRAGARDPACRRSERRTGSCGTRRSVPLRRTGCDRTPGSCSRRTRNRADQDARPVRTDRQLPYLRRISRCARYTPIFEAMEATGLPMYLHPREPAPSMVTPFLDYGLYFAGWGFAVETGLHAMRLIMSGTFARFPKLKIILGHMGEGIPFWLQRIDNRYLLQVKIGAVEKAAAPAERIFLGEFRHHHRRRDLDAGAAAEHRRSRRRTHPVRGGFSLRGRRRGCALPE